MGRRPSPKGKGLKKRKRTRHSRVVISSDLIDAELPCGNLILEPRNSARCDLVSGGKTAGFHLAVKRRPRERDQGEHLLYAQHRPNLSGSRVLFTFVCVDHSPSCPQRSRSGHPATRRATRTCVFANPENVGRVDHPEHHAQARPKWNGGCKLIVRLGATAHKKERSCPRF